MTKRADPICSTRFEPTGKNPPLLLNRWNVTCPPGYSITGSLRFPTFSSCPFDGVPCRACNSAGVVSRKHRSPRLGRRKRGFGRVVTTIRRRSAGAVIRVACHGHPPQVIPFLYSIKFLRRQNFHQNSRGNFSLPTAREQVVSGSETIMPYPARVGVPAGKSRAALLTWEDRCCSKRIPAKPIWGILNTIKPKLNEHRLFAE
jgi:hypothetical protein